MHSPIHVVIEQPSLAKYRVAVFRELARRPGIDLTLFYGEAPGIPNVAPDGFRGEYIPLRHWTIGGQIFRWHKAQWQAPSREDVDVAILSWNVRYLSLIPTLLRGWWKRVPIVLWGHGVSKKENRIRRTWRLFITRLASAILVYDHDTARKLAEFGLPANKLFVAPNAFDQSAVKQARDEWLANPSRLEQFKSDNDLNNREILLLVARLVPKRRVELLLLATAELLPQHPRLLTVIIGDGGEEKQRLQTLAQEKGLASHVRFIDGIYDETSLAPWFLCSNLFVCPSFIGLSLLHAFGYGLPVITSNAIDQHGPEIVALRNGVNGLLYKANSLPELTAAINRVLLDVPLRTEMSLNATQMAHEEFTVDRMVDGFVSAIEYSHSQRKQP